MMVKKSKFILTLFLFLGIENTVEIYYNYIERSDTIVHIKSKIFKPLVS